MDRKHAKEVKDLPLANRHVNMSNTLVMASHGLNSVAEHRLVKACVSKLDSIRPDQHNRYKITLNAQEFAETFHISMQNAYEQLKDVSKKLLTRTIKREIETRKGKKISEDHWVSGITYHEGEGWVELRFSPEATPYLLQLNGNHTSYELKMAASLRSVYSWRLMEMFMRFKSTGWLDISIEDFQAAMDAPPSARANFKELRRAIIEPAMKELREKENWLIEFETKKAGRKVTGLHFVFKYNPQGRLDV